MSRVRVRLSAVRFSAVPLSAQPINIDLSGDANWGNYRYRVFETVVPIRNVAWMGAITGC